MSVYLKHHQYRSAMLSGACEQHLWPLPQCKVLPILIEGILD